MSANLMYLLGVVAIFLLPYFFRVGLVGASVLPERTRARADKAPYAFLKITMHGRALDGGSGANNGLTVYRDLYLTFYYGPASGVCNPPSNSQNQKITLVQTPATGFQALVAGPLVATCFARDWINNGIYAQWIDTPTDLDLQVGSATLVGPAAGGGGAAAGPGSGGVVPAGGYLTPTGDGGVGAALGSRLPLDNNVTIHKYTGQKGRSWSGKAWHPSCVPVTFFNNDDMSAAGIAAWSAVKAALYAPISDIVGGVGSTLYPIQISDNNSQLRRNPTTVGWCPLILPGVDPVRGITNPIVNTTLGEARRRRERHGLTF